MGMSHMSTILILIFQYKSLVHLKYYILIQTPSQSDFWLQRYIQFSNVQKQSKTICHLFYNATQNRNYRHLIHSPWSRHIYLIFSYDSGYGDHWSELIGASHTKDYTIWEYGGLSTLGVKRVAELGSPVQLEREIRAQVCIIKCTSWSELF